MKKITIVGGGTAGWMTAAYLAKYRGSENITVVESPNIPKIRVGESVTPHVCNFFEEIGIDEFNWMKETGAIHKYANKFINWRGTYDTQYFSFNYTTPVNSFYKDIPVNIVKEDFSDNPLLPRNIDILSDLCNSNILNRFDQYFNPQFHYMEKNVAPYLNNNDLLNQPFSHAHHINAELAGSYIKNKIANDVTVIESNVLQVNVKNDHITSLELENGDIITADLYIDCTGFNKVLVNALGWKEKKYNTPIDRAWVCQTNYTDPEAEMTNYTKSIAEPYGWRFKIGLYHQMGNGYCYSSKHISDEDALDYFLTQIDNTRAEPRLIKWEPGRLEKFGEGNCAAIGLSCGFTEPLEANALYTIITSIRRLNNVLDNPNLDFSVYNEKMAYTIDDISDFILVHYTLSPRNDTKFWRDMQKIGKEKNHKQLVIDKINNPNNTMKAATQGYTMFPDYMWVQLALHWGIDFETNKYDQHAERLASAYFEYNENKHNYISDLCKNNYLWHRDNIFKIESNNW